MKEIFHQKLRKMANSKGHFLFRKDAEGKNLFTWKQFSSPFAGNSSSSSAMGRESRHNNSFEYVVEATHAEPIRVVSEATLLKDANSNLMKKIVQRDQECKGLQEQLLIATKDNNELLIDLKEVSMTNQRLRIQSLALQEENDLLHSQLSAFRRRLTSSSPTSPGLSCFPIWNTSQILSNSDDTKESNQKPAETWEDLSEQMLKQMQLEIRQMESEREQKISQEESQLVPLASQEDISTDASAEVCHPPCTATADSLSLQCELDSAHSIIQLLKSQVEQLKAQLVTQGTILRNALGQIHKFFSADPSVRVKARILSQSSQGSDGAASGSKISRPSDELFRAYFTQQLHSSAGTAPLKTQETEAKTALVSNSEETNVKHVILSSLLDKTDSQEKVCPMCQIALPPGTPQADFESHVFECLDRESTLEQFEVV